jgi:hypothetical protein
MSPSSTNIGFSLLRLDTFHANAAVLALNSLELLAGAEVRQMSDAKDGKEAVYVGRRNVQVNQWMQVSRHEHRRPPVSNGWPRDITRNELWGYVANTFRHGLDGLVLPWTCLFCRGVLVRHVAMAAFRATMFLRRRALEARTPPAQQQSVYEHKTNQPGSSVMSHIT